ncbi:MAG: STAS domain-containing protein [Deferribacterales bacterium]
MEIKELKTKIKVTFPDESEIFMAEEFLSLFGEISFGGKELEADMTKVSSMDTVFLQITLSLFKTAKDAGSKITLKSCESFDKLISLYGLQIQDAIGGN